MLNYLLSPEFQIVNTAGKPCTGYLEVYISGSRERYYCASDFDGTLYPFHVPLDSLGSNVVLADDSHAYDVYVYNRYGSLLMSRYNVHPGAGGGIGTGDITSSDGSIIVTQTANGVDLRTNSTPPSILRATAATLYADGQFVFSEAQRDGQNAIVDAQGKVIVNEGWWHYDATVRLRWPGPAQNETQSVSLYTQNASDSMTVDLSFAHSETVQVSGEYKALNDSTQFVLGVTGVPSGMSVELVDFGVHSIIGEGAGGKYDAGNGIVIDEPNRIISVDFDEVQEKLTAGTGISIDNEGVISVDESAVQEIFPVTYDSTTFQEIRTALIAGQLPVMFRNDGADFALQVQRIPLHTFFDVGGSSGSSYAQFWSPYVYTSSSPSLPPYALFAVYTASYDFETHNTTWSTSYKYISEQSDWAEADATKLTFIKNKPDLSVYATQTELTNGLATKQDVISDLATIRAGAAAGATAVQDADYVHTDNNFTDADATKLSGIQAGAEVNVQSDWAESDSSSDAYIQNKPAIPSGSQLVPSATPSDAGEVLTVDQQGVPAWAPAQAPISAGNGVDITNNVVSTKVDGTTIGFNASGELETLVGNDSAYLAHYGTTTYAEISAAVAAGKAVFVTDVSGAITAVMPMTSFNTNPAMVIFTLLIGSIEYKATLSSGTWSATTVDIQADWNEASQLSPAYINNKPAIPSGVQLVPAATPADANKVLTVNAFGAPNWAATASQVNSDWDATSGVAEILNKPTEKPLVAGDNITITEGADSVTISTTSTAQVNADWLAVSGPAEILNKPQLATVATSGSYTDLTDTPVIPAAQVNADWDATSGVSEILNKPTLATVATSGSYNDLSDTPDLSVYAETSELATVATSGDYNDLTNKPSIPPAQVNSDWDATSGISQILNKPEETTLTAGENITITESGSTLTISSTSAPQQKADWDATSGVSEILNKPDLSIYAQSADLAAVATTGSYNSLTDTPTIPAAQVNSDWDATSGVAEILNKPDLVDIVAGTGIAIDNPDGNTLRVTNVGFPISETDAVRCGTFKNDPMFMKTYTFTSTVGTSETTINMTIDEKKGTGGVNRIWIDPSNSFVLYGSAGSNFLPISWRLSSGRQGSVSVLGASNGTLSCRCVDTSSTPLTFNITIRFTVSNS